jgi:outer membrane lipoprotein SlyB
MKPYYILALPLLLAACPSTPLTSDQYANYEAQRAQVVTYGTIEGVREVEIQGGPSGVGAVGGAVGGGIAGSAIGEGKGAALGAVAGAVAGGVAGDAIDSKLRKDNGVELTIKLESGTTIAIVQGISKKEKPFTMGERVKVLTSPTGNTRVTH